jgi:hypothetical protein
MDYLGPYVQFVSSKKGQWHSTVLVLLKEDTKEKEGTTPNVFVNHEFYSSACYMETVQGYHVFITDLKIKILKERQLVNYSILVGEDLIASNFVRVPGRNDSWSVGFFSCNGTDHQDGCDIVTPWENVNSANLDLLIGGGDQLYCDDVWNIPELAEWNGLSTEDKILYKTTHVIQDAMEHFYFQKYAEVFESKNFKKVLSSVPYAFSWDDHDIIDGWGSFPPEQLNCEVMQAIFRAAKKCYFIFQKHYRQGTFVEFADVLMCLPDTRGKRTLEHILPRESWKEIFDKLHSKLQDKIQSNNQVRHLLFVLPLPIAGFPSVQFHQKVLYGVNYFKGLIKKAGLDFLNKFGNVSLIGDCADQWTSSFHYNEREEFLALCEDLCEKTGVRITFLSGDVHCGGFGVYRGSKAEMTQIISSPISNFPVPSAISYAHNLPIWNLFENGRNVKGYKVNGKSYGLISSRNWCKMLISRESIQANLIIETKSKEWVERHEPIEIPANEK